MTAREVAIWNEAVDRCATAARMEDRIGLEWVRDSLWDAIVRRQAARIAAVKITSGEA